MTLQEIEYTLYDIFGFDVNAPEQRTIKRLRRLINQSYHSIMGQRGLSKLRRTVLTCQTQAGSPFMVLPQAATSLITLSDRSNAWPLAEVTLEDLRACDPALSAISTNPDRYVVLNYAAATVTDPIAIGGSTLWAVSNYTDTGMVIHVEGVRSGGYAARSRINAPLTGTTPVDVTGYGDWVMVTKFMQSPAPPSFVMPNGVITLHEGSGGRTLATIIQGAYSSRYTKLHLYPTPQSVVTLYADVELHIHDLSNPADEPLIHEDFHWVLVAGAAELEYKRRGKLPEMGEERKRKQAGVDDMKLVLQKRTGVAGKDRQRFSQLGPWFPVGT